MQSYDTLLRWIRINHCLPIHTISCHNVRLLASKQSRCIVRGMKQILDALVKTNLCLHARLAYGRRMHAWSTRANLPCGKIILETPTVAIYSSFIVWLSSSNVGVYCRVFPKGHIGLFCAICNCHTRCLWTSVRWTCIKTDDENTTDAAYALTFSLRNTIWILCGLSVQGKASWLNFRLCCDFLTSKLSSVRQHYE